MCTTLTFNRYQYPWAQLAICDRQVMSCCFQAAGTADSRIRLANQSSLSTDTIKLHGSNILRPTICQWCCLEVGCAGASGKTQGQVSQPAASGEGIKYRPSPIPSMMLPLGKKFVVSLG